MATDRSRAMPRVDAVWNHPVYQERYRVLQRAERDRAFCSHDLQHFLDVARIAWTVLLERGVAVSYADALSGGDAAADAHWPKVARDVVYAAALLHDIGRADEYESGEPHDIAGPRIAAEILGTVEQDKRFSSGECEQILAAIAHHRTSAGCAGGASAEGVCSAGALADALRYADKAARACYACPARELCNWPDGKKNLAITW
ncbi:HD domain-containing protein [Collinsella tanakaei]|uniref:HD domain-containing protein n=1 Tax=Collinsella tanakaei TaxID=626935 RepID=UPI00265AFBBD|nr:HD domain-containing protein [Collinsella tanakaei]